MKIINRTLSKSIRAKLQEDQEQAMYMYEAFRNGGSVVISYSSKDGRQFKCEFYGHISKAGNMIIDNLEPLR